MARGFSLLELLVVVFLIGVLATMFTLSVGLIGDDSDLETEVDRLVALINLAREESISQGQEIGLSFTPNGYEFAAFYEDFIEYRAEDEKSTSEWALLDNSSLLEPRRLPEGLIFELEIDGREIVLKYPSEDKKGAADKQDDDDADSEDQYQPQVMILSSGDMSPFTVHIRREFENEGQWIEFNVAGARVLDEDET